MPRQQIDPENFYNDLRSFTSKRSDQIAKSSMKELREYRDYLKEISKDLKAHQRLVDEVIEKKIEGVEREVQYAKPVQQVQSQPVVKPVVRPLSPQQLAAIKSQMK